MHADTLKKLKIPGVFLLIIVIIILYVTESGSQFFLQQYKGISSEMSGDSAHWNNGIPCLTCHVLHMSPGAQLTAVDGNANLCMSCHNPGGGMANNTPFSNSDIAVPGVSGTSHAWNKAAINDKYGANFPTNYQMAGKVMSEEIVCSTCHQPHDQFYQPFLRTSNDQDAMCKDCHSVRDIGCYADDTTYKGSHPVGKVYQGADSRFNATPLDPSIIIINTKVECSSCHGVHYATSGNANNGTGDGYLLRASNDDNLCASCHTYTSHQGMGCTRCHQPHNPNRANIYMIRDTVETASSGLKPVVFYRDTGLYSFADGNGIYNGICEVCHTQTDHFRNDGSAPDQNHDNMGGQGGNNCLSCHMHNNEFYSVHTYPLAGTGCEECHGHEAGWEYSPGLYSQGRGSTHSHSTHTENDADDLKGPFIACAECHDTNEFPFFKSGTDGNGDGKYNLAETDVCNTCHSPGGSYDGVDDAVIGAKNNWDNGVYTGSDLTAGKEKWCAGCHDESPANSMYDSTGVDAPKVIGDENASYIYGTGYGFYKTGHGLADTVTYPASGGVTDGAGLTCGDCHDFSLAHIDHDSRTYDDGDLSTTSPSVYQIAYRLKLVGGLDPMIIPSPANSGNSADRFRLCYSCHDSGPFLSSSNMNTNLVTVGVNRHYYHVNRHTLQYSADYDYVVYNSRMTCVTCHNVHGSSNLTMVRNGELIDRELGLRIWYNNDDITTYVTWNTTGPDPENVSLAASTGTVWSGGSSSNLCTHCHGSNNTTPEYRYPFQDVNTAPWLEWAGDLDFENDGVNHDTSFANTPIIFRVNYFDINNDLPSINQLLVDTNGDGVTDTLNMSVAPEDLNVTDGSAYYVVLNIAKSTVLGPGDVDYKFNFVSTDSVATGIPITNHQFHLYNNTPTLDWTGNLFYESDGIHPNVGPTGDFDFEIVYTDNDGDIPSSLKLIIDDVLPGYDMIAGAGSITTGRTYSQTVSLLSPGSHTYRFFAVDNGVWGDTAILKTESISNTTFTVTSTANNVSVLDYVNGSCFTNSVMPIRGPIDGDYDFNVIYTDYDDEAPTEIKVVVDGVDEYLLSAISGTILTGMTYGTTIQINTAGDHTYHFYATDGTDVAVGNPSIVNGDTLTVFNALKVKLNDVRPGWYGNIQDAVDAFYDTLIMVYPATYHEKLSLQSLTDDKITIEAICGPENTIIDSTGTIIYFNSIPTYTRLIGFTITGGTTGAWFRAADAQVENCIFCNNTNRGIYSSHGSSMTLSNTIVRDNNEFGTNVNGDGAGIMFNGGGLPVISGCVISNNHSTGRGGGIFAQNLTGGNYLTVTDTEISNNTSASTGGGIGSNVSNLVIINSKIISNTSSGAAGAFYVQGSGITLDVQNSIIGNNRAVEAGGVWLNMLASVTISNSLFIGNETTDLISNRGGAIYTNIACYPVITNTIFKDNDAGRGDDIYAHQSTEIFTFNYCCMINNGDKLFGNGGAFLIDSTNIFSDPLFEDEAAGDYRLIPISPCIDIGTSTGAPAIDINGLTRGIDGRVDGNITGDLSDYDIGAYEYY